LQACLEEVSKFLLEYAGKTTAGEGRQAKDALYVSSLYCSCFVKLSNRMLEEFSFFRNVTNFPEITFLILERKASSDVLFTVTPNPNYSENFNWTWNNFISSKQGPQ
jgi:hypothetical protein